MRNIPFMTTRPIAHRGYYDNVTIPENSLLAFKRAVDNNFMIELDIQLTKDNQVVVFHDNTLKRMCNQPNNIKDYTYAELCKFKLGETDYQIPLFSEVLKVIGAKVPVIIEMKHEKEKDPDLPRISYELLKDYHGEFVVQSFDPFLVKAYKKLNPAILRGILVYDYADNPMPKPVSRLLAGLHFNFLMKPDFINSEMHYKPKKLRKFKEKGGAVICYTARSEADYKEAFTYFDNVIFEKFEPKYFYTRKHIDSK